MPISDWIRRDEPPEDYYALVERQRFDPATEALIEAVRKANKQLLPYQNHAKIAVRTRALLLMKALAQADLTFADPNRRSTYDRALAVKLLGRFRPGQGYDSMRLGNWLVEQEGVHPGSLPFLLALARGDMSGTRAGDPTPARTSDLPTEPIDLGTDWEEIASEPDWSSVGTLRDVGLDLVELMEAEEDQASAPAEPMNETLKFLLILVGVAIGALAFAFAMLFLAGAVSGWIGGGAEEVEPAFSSKEMGEGGSGVGPDPLASVEPTPVVDEVREPREALDQAATSTNAAVVPSPVGPTTAPAVTTRPYSFDDGGGQLLTVMATPGTAARYEAAQSIMATQNWIKARSIFAQILETEPDFWPARVAHGECSFQLGELRAARADFEAANAAAPESCVALVRLGEAELETGDLLLGREHFESAHERNRANAESLAGIALMEYYSNNHAEALRQAIRAIEVDPKCGMALMMRSNLERDPEVSISYSRTAFEVDPTRLTIRVMNSIARVAAEPWTIEAEAARFADAQPVQALDMVLLAILAMQNQDNERAAKLLDRAIDQVPNFQVAIILRSQIVT